MTLGLPCDHDGYDLRIPQCLQCFSRGCPKRDNCRPPPPRQPTLYSTKQTPRGSVVVLGDRIISEHEMSEASAQQAADWLNHRKTA